MSINIEEFSFKNPPKRTMRKYENCEVCSPLDKKNFIRKIKTELETKEFFFTENNFPYDTKYDHFCLWTKNKMNEEEIVKILTGLGVNYKTFFENIPEFRSIMEITHYHVFLIKS